MVSIDGDFQLSTSATSPNARYAARGKSSGIEITDFSTGHILWTVNAARRLGEWASGHQLAWSSGAHRFDFESRRPYPDAESVEVSVIDVTTGEIEVMDSADYLARFRPPPRAALECPEHPAEPCRIILDGEVVAEGRWARIVGSIDVD